jgi:hypothetical protein
MHLKNYPLRASRILVFVVSVLVSHILLRAQDADQSADTDESPQGEVHAVKGSPNLDSSGATLVELIDVRLSSNSGQSEFEAGEFLSVLLKYQDALKKVSQEFKSARTQTEYGKAGTTFVSGIFIPLINDLERSGLLDDPEIKENDTVVKFLRVSEQIRYATDILELMPKFDGVKIQLQTIQKANSTSEVLAAAGRLVELLRPVRDWQNSNRYPLIVSSQPYAAFVQAYDQAKQLIESSETIDSQVRAFRETVAALVKRDVQTEIRRQMQEVIIQRLVDSVNQEFNLNITSQNIADFVSILRDPSFYADLFVTNELKQWFNDSASYKYDVDDDCSVTVKLLLDQGTNVRIFSKSKQISAPLRCKLIYHDSGTDSTISSIVVAAKGISFRYEEGGRYSLNFDNLEVDGRASAEETIKSNIADWVNQYLKESGVSVTITKYPDSDPTLECDLSVEFSELLKIELSHVRFAGNRLDVDDTTIRVAYKLQPPLELGYSVCFHEFGGYSRPGHREFGPSMKLGSTYLAPEAMHVRICGSAKVPEEFGDGEKLFRHILELVGEMKRERPGLAKNSLLKMREMFLQQQYLNHTGGLYIFDQKLSHFIGHTDFATGKIWGKYIRGRRNSWKRVSIGKTTAPQKGEQWEWVYGDWSGDESSPLEHRGEKYDIRLTLDDHKKHFDDYCCGKEMIEAKVSHQGNDYNLAYKEGKFSLENGVLVMTGEVELFGRDCDTITTLLDFEKGRAMITADKGVELFSEDFAPSLTGELLFNERKVVVEGAQIILLPVPPFGDLSMAVQIRAEGPLFAESPTALAQATKVHVKVHCFKDKSTIEFDVPSLADCDREQIIQRLHKQSPEVFAQHLIDLASQRPDWAKQWEQKAAERMRLVFGGSGKTGNPILNKIGGGLTEALQSASSLGSIADPSQIEQVLNGVPGGQPPQTLPFGL